MIYYANRSDLVTEQRRDELIQFLDKTITDAPERFPIPGYQTQLGVLDRPEFFWIHESFRNACSSIGQENDDHLVICWSYIDWIGSPQAVHKLRRWHAHSRGIVSGVMLLQIPEEETTNALYGTQFKGFGYSQPTELCWVMFNSDTFHRAGRPSSNSRRYIIAADLVTQERAKSIFG